MSQENLSSHNEVEPSLWAQYAGLASRYDELQRSGASEEELDAAADNLDSSVDDLVQNGEVDPNEAYNLTSGEYPFPEIKLNP